MHDPTKVLLGTTGSSDKEVSSHIGVIAAGLFTTLDEDDALSIVLADGNLLGVSLGSDLSNAGFSAICRSGSRVPVQVDFSPTIGAQVTAHATTGKATAAGTGVNATYVSEVLTGIKEDGTEVNVAYIDFVGGL